MWSSQSRFPASQGLWSILLVVGLAAGAAMADDNECCTDETAPAPAQKSQRSMMLARALIAQRGEFGDGASLCFVPNPTPEQLDNIMTRFQALPPTLSPFDSRYITSSPVWTGNGGQGASGTATRANLTYSFPADGVTWGDGSNGPSAPNTLHGSLQTLFGVANQDHGLELIRQALCAWHRFGGINYTEVADDNSVYTKSIPHVSTRGDIRIGGNPQGTSSGILAYDQFPAGNGTGGSDMAINTDFFPVAQQALGSSANNYRYLRNVVSHEHGHGLGFIHPVPCNATKLMEPFINLNFETLQIDEMRGAGRNYGDRRSGNSSSLLAVDWGNLTTPVTKSVIERNLSTNGTGVADWFKFTIDTDQNVVITAAPLGGSYTEGQQSSGCNGTTATINAGQAGNLNIELRNGTNGATVLQTGATGAAGSTETLSAGTLSAGTYWVRVFDAANSGAANQIVQLYDLTMRVGAGDGAKAPPVAVAGLHKRVQAGANCFFIGDINSYTTDTGPGGGNSLSYSWDLDGNGTFGDSTSPEPVWQYSSNGTFNVTLRVTDQNSLSSTDTIQVVVFGASASIVSLIPSSFTAGVTTPVTINGTNFKGVTAASQLSASGLGVSFTGTPIVNVMGTQITGLNVVVAAGLGADTRDVSITNSDGSGTASGNGTGTGLLTITGGCTPPVILAQPQPHVVCANNSVVLNIGATGGPLTFQWRKNGSPIAGATNNFLSISHVTQANVGMYDVVLTNSCGPTTSNEAALTIDASGITAQPTPQVSCIGGSATFTIGTDGAQDFQWQKDGVDIGGANGRTLTFNPVAQSDQGVYTCTIDTNCDTIVSNGAALTIGGSLSIGAQPGSQSVCENGSASFTFNVDGATGFQWRKGGVDIAGATSPTLTFNPAALIDTGGYDCVVSGGCAPLTSSVATLSVCSAVAIASGGQPASQTPCLGGSASFTVNATGTALSYQWRKGGNPIDGATSSTLTLNPVASADAGSYDCVVSNCCQPVTSAGATLTVCAADFNCSGDLSVQDIFDFLNGWFAGVPLADFNAVNGITVQDIFDFLNAWFAGC